MMINKKFQFVNWFPEWRGFYYFKLHKEETGLAYIYDWILGFAFWEIRKWHTLKVGEVEQAVKESITGGLEK